MITTSTEQGGSNGLLLAALESDRQGKEKL